MDVQDVVLRLVAFASAALLACGPAVDFSGSEAMTVGGIGGGSVGSAGTSAATASDAGSASGHSGAASCDPATYRAHCAVDTLVYCLDSGNGVGVLTQMSCTSFLPSEYGVGCCIDNGSLASCWGPSVCRQGTDVQIYILAGSVSGARA